MNFVEFIKKGNFLRRDNDKIYTCIYTKRAYFLYKFSTVMTFLDKTVYMDMNNNNYFLLFIEYLYKLPLSTSSYTNNRRKSTMTRIVFIYFGVICQFVIFPMNSLLLLLIPLILNCFDLFL